MLYVKRNIQNELCLIEISLSVLSNDNYIFTDGNAASQNTKFYNLNEDLKQLIRDWVSSEQIVESARDSDFISMKEDWILKAIKWFTTLEEVLRVV